MKKIVLPALIVLLFAACSDYKAEHVEKAFYFWKNDQYEFSPTEDSILQGQAIRKLYIKFFEVEKNEVMGNVPIAKTGLHMYNRYENFTVVPTVYIKNEVFKNATQASLDKLADNVYFLINKYSTDYKFSNVKSIDEYQMDCDWTLSTRDSYFYFLKKLKQLSNKKISCTLRLYPYKYPDKMGVPPVDTAMLMCYNLINPLQNHKKNSILDLDELSSYLDSDKKYPLHLDIALPVYSWMMVYQNNHFAKVLYTDTNAIRSILKKKEDLWYAVTKDTVVNDFYLRIGDKVKIEETTPSQLKEAIKIIKSNVPLDNQITVSLFHLEDKQLSRFTNEDLTIFFTDFTQ